MSDDLSMADAEMPDQPDGIEDDSRDMPGPLLAAARVLAYVTQTGDGLYDVEGGAPLYGRDLESLCRAALGYADLLGEVERFPEDRDQYRGQIARLFRERDALAATVARVEGLIPSRMVRLVFADEIRAALHPTEGGAR